MRTRRFFKTGLTVLLLCALCLSSSVTVAAVGRDNILHPLQAEVFYKELQYLINEHGGIYVGSSTSTLPYGLLSANVVDFDADGINELLMVYRSKKTGECYYKLMAYIDNVSKTLKEERLYGDNIKLATSGQQAYFITNSISAISQAALTENYNTVGNGLHKIDNSFANLGAYYVNGVAVAQSEYSSKKGAYTVAQTDYVNGHQSGFSSADIEAYVFQLTGTVNRVKQAITPLAIPIASAVSVNGNLIQFEAYNINGSNYFKIRDIAYMINGTKKQFAVDFDRVVNAVTIATEKPYVSNKTEMLQGPGVTISAALSKQTVLLNGEAKRFEAYNIYGSNYFKLRDLGEAIDFGVVWNSTTGGIEIRTEESYRP